MQVTSTGSCLATNLLFELSNMKNILDIIVDIRDSVWSLQYIKANTQKELLLLDKHLNQNWYHKTWL